jgi:uncharacterized protein (TIGR02284 family)
MNYSEKISKKLNTLLQKTYDAKKGYQLAAEKVESPAVKQFLNDKVLQRKHFAADLKAAIQEFGWEAEKEGSLKGDIHRGWMELMASLTGNETERILEEVERGETASIKEYNAILEDDTYSLMPKTRTLLENQRDAIQAALNTSRMYETLVS